MILKDEAHTIKRTLNSVKGCIDRWVVVDTGSTDGTKEIVKNVLKNVPGDLHEVPFIDFSTTRNMAIELAGSDQEFLLMLDADDELIGGKELQTFLRGELQKINPPNAYYIQLDTGVKFDSARIIRPGKGWKYTGVVHEVICHPTEFPAPRIPNVLIKHFPDEKGSAKTAKRWERDVILLSNELEKNPHDARSAFYLAQTLRWLGKFKEAIPVYEHRVSLGGWWEEVYESKMALVGCRAQLGYSRPEQLLMYLDVHSQFPHRAEPLFHAAQLCYMSQNHAMTYLYARRATEIERPKDVKLFVDEDIYKWKAHDLVAISAFYISAFKTGENSARIALQHNPDNERMKKNLEFYLKLIPPT